MVGGSVPKGKVMQLYFLGDTNNKGTYYWWSKQHNGWVVADLDGGKAAVHDRLVVFLCKGNDAEDTLNEVAIGQEGEKWLVSEKDAIVLWRDYADGFGTLEILVVNDVDGRQVSGHTAQQVFDALGGVLRRAKKKL
jgi:hypothetical protein